MNTYNRFKVYWTSLIKYGHNYAIQKNILNAFRKGFSITLTLNFIIAHKTTNKTVAHTIS